MVQSIDPRSLFYGAQIPFQQGYRRKEIEVRRQLLKERSRNIKLE
jgi:hypothetical protein